MKIPEKLQVCVSYLKAFIINFRFTDEDVDEMYREAPIKNGMFDYTEFTRILKHGAKEKDEA